MPIESRGNSNDAWDSFPDPTFMTWIFDTNTDNPSRAHDLTAEQRTELILRVGTDRRMCRMKIDDKAETMPLRRCSRTRTCGTSACLRADYMRRNHSSRLAGLAEHRLPVERGAGTAA